MEEKKLKELSDITKIIHNTYYDEWKKVTKGVSHNFKIENVFDKSDETENGVYDLEFIDTSVVLDKLEEFKNVSDKDKSCYVISRRIIREIYKESSLECKITLGDNVIMESYIKGTRTSCAIGLFKGLDIRNLNMFIVYLIENNIDILDFFRDYFNEIMSVNKITQLIFSNSTESLGKGLRIINLILDILCDTKTDIGINKNGGNKVKTWILTDYPEFYEEPYECNVCLDDSDMCCC